MSIFSKLGRVVRKALPIVASFIPGVGGVIAGAASSVINRQTGGGIMAQSILPSLPAIAGGAIRTLPGIGSRLMAGGLPAAVGFGAGRAVRSARAIASAASSYCRRHPGWCASIGGLAAVEGLVNSGQLPVPKRRRRKGISGRDLGNFMRVSKVLSRYCAPIRKARSSPAARGK